MTFLASFLKTEKLAMENYCLAVSVGRSLSVFILCLFTFAFTVYLLSETGEAFLEECPNNKREKKTLILKRVRLGTKILTDGWSSYKHFQELGSVGFVCCRMRLMLTSHDIIGIWSAIQSIL